MHRWTKDMEKCFDSLTGISNSSSAPQECCRCSSDIMSCVCVSFADSRASVPAGCGAVYRLVRADPPVDHTFFPDEISLLKLNTMHTFMYPHRHACSGAFLYV